MSVLESVWKKKWSLSWLEEGVNNRMIWKKDDVLNYIKMHLNFDKAIHFPFQFELEKSRNELESMDLEMAQLKAVS